MAVIKPTNFAKAVLATPPSGVGGLSFTVAAGKGALYPSPGAGEYFYGCFTNAARSAYEIVKIEARSTDSFTVAAGGRGADGTTAATWSTSDIFFLPTTRAMWDDIGVFGAAAQALADVTPAANKVPYFTSATAASVADFTASARSIAGLAVTAKGDVYSGSAADTMVKTAVGADGTGLMAKASATGGVEWGYPIPTGVPLPYWGTTAPAGFVFHCGTIGNAASGGTQRANADTETLFTLLYNALADAEAPVSGGRGANAAADYAANKTITIPDARGRGFFGRDNMSGLGTTSRITAAVSGIDGAVLGKAGGSQSSQQHTHTANVTDGGHAHGKGATVATPFSFDAGGAGVGDIVTGSSTDAAVTGITVTNVNSGAGTSENMPPALICNVILKL